MYIRLLSFIFCCLAAINVSLAQKSTVKTEIESYTAARETDGIYKIDRYEYSTGELIGSIFSSKGTSLEGKKINAYSISADGQKILLETEHTPIYRRSYTAVCYVYDSKKDSVTPLACSQAVMCPTFSPDGTRVAYSMANDLYIQDIATSQITRLTSDGSHGSIINGTADWVYEEEFSIVKMYDWSPSGRYIGYVRSDESRVMLYDMPMYYQGTYPSLYTFKYPKAGYENSTVSIHIYDTHTGGTSTVDMGSEKDYYIPRISWLPHSEKMIFTHMNRLQNHMDIYTVDPSTMEKKILWSDYDSAYINLNDYTHYLDDGSVAFVSERDGHAHLYIQDAKGKIRQVTQGEWDITTLYGLSSDKKKAYVQTTRSGSENRDIAAVDIRTGKVSTLSTQTGTNDASFSAACRYYTLSFSSSTNMGVRSLHRAADGSLIRTISDLTQMSIESIKNGHLVKEISMMEISDSLSLKTWRILPPDFDSTRRYPVLMYVYGGPGSQLVLNRWAVSMENWMESLAKKGYIIYCVDGRGTGGRGARFEKQIYRRMGELELIDQVAAARKIGELPYVDKNRIGIFGWSFGGYMASLAATRHSDVFCAAIAVAPVTSWRMYDTVYTERFLATPQENPLGYDQNSPLTYASDMKCRFLLVHGTADDNVHYQNSARFSSLLVEAGIPFEQMIYTDKNHSILGKARQHLYDKMTLFLVNNL
ncbi:MAG: S9 family peptidase [Flavobacteriales bacterium]|nr:S9 family peptidase [Flavobacteriales bacterium]